MIVDSTTYLLSMISVYGAAAILLIFFPMLMWRGYLKGKSFLNKFLFSLLTQNCFVINLVLLLGFFGICNRYTMYAGLALEYIVVRWTFSERTFFVTLREWKKVISLLLQGQTTLYDVRQQVRLWFFKRRKTMAIASRGRKAVSSLFPVAFFAVVIAYNALFLTHQVRIYHSYQFSDLPVHLSWIYELSQGNLFSDGIYPFGMHAMVYVLSTLFPMGSREVILYYGSFQTVMAMLTFFIFAKRIFRWKYTPYFAVALWSILLNQGRYAASLPQECGVFAFFAMGYFLVGMFQRRTEKFTVRADSKVRSFFRINQYFSRKYLDYDFFMLVLSVALQIEFHFYTAIAGVIFAVSIVLAYLFRFLKKQYFVPIVLAAVLGAAIAIVPFAASYAAGTPLQDSLNWAMSVINNEEWEGTGAGYLESIAEETDNEEIKQRAENATSKVEERIPIYSRGLSGKELATETTRLLREYNNSYVLGSRLMDLVWLSLAVCGIFCLIFLPFRRLRGQIPKVLLVAFVCLFLSVMGASKSLGLVVILEANRASVFLEPFYFLAVAMALDCLFAIPALVDNRIFRGVLAVVSIGVFGLLSWALVHEGYLHNYFDVNQSYYNEPDYLINRIKKQFDPFTYTIISPTDEYYAVVDNGFHYEISELVAKVDSGEPELKIPTKYVFTFIEKITLNDYFYQRDHVSPEYAKQNFVFRASTQDYFYQRNIIESKAYYWAQKFAEVYPNQMKVFFENDIYVAYILVQDENVPLNLSVDYTDLLEG